MARVVSTKAGYDRWAAVYDTDGNPLTALEEPVVRRLLGPVKGKRLLDVGCGTGRHAVPLAQAGADVVGVDFSKGMLSRACARAEKAGAAAEFFVHDAKRPLPFKDGAFDLVISCLVLEHVKDLGGFFRQLARLVKPRGRVVVSAMHPAMFLKGTSARFTDPATGHKILPQSHVQTLSDYVLAATRAGLRIDEMVEKAADARLAKKYPRAVKHVGWPLLVAFRLSRA